MAIAYDSSVKIFALPGASTGEDLTIASVSNRYLFVLTDIATAVSYDGVSLTKLNTHTITSNAGFNYVPTISVWGLANPSVGTHEVLVTVPSGSQTDTAIAVCYNGVDPVAAEAYAVNQTNGNRVSQQTDSIFTLTDNAWVATFIKGVDNLGRNFTAGAGTTLRQTESTGTNNNAAGILDSNGAKTPTGSYSLVTNWSSGTGWFSSIMYSLKPYITATFSGPSSGNVNSASTNFTVTPDVAVNGTITITPSGTGSTGLSPIVLTFSNSATPQTFTITPTTAGSITLTMTNGCGINNAAPLTYTANAVVPGAPVIGTAIPGNTTASVAFSAPSTNGGATITNYTATSSPGSFTGTGASSPIIVTGLTNGVAYTFTVTATNSAGTGPASSASNSVTPYVAATSYTLTGPSSGNVRSASTNFTVTPNAVYFGTITITPSGAGSEGLSPIVFTFNGSATPQTFTITPLESGLITLTGTNSNGLSNPSALNYTANAVVPLAPSISAVIPGIREITVGVAAPTNDGGSNITMYTVYCSNGQTKTLVDEGQVTFSDLNPEDSYTFYANCTNSIGVSANSATSDAVSPQDESARIYNNAPKFNLDSGVGNVLSF